MIEALLYTTAPQCDVTASSCLKCERPGFHPRMYCNDFQIDVYCFIKVVHNDSGIFTVKGSASTSFCEANKYKSSLANPSCKTGNIPKGTECIDCCKQLSCAPGHLYCNKETIQSVHMPYTVTTGTTTPTTMTKTTTQQTTTTTTQQTTTTTTQQTTTTTTQQTTTTTTQPPTQSTQATSSHTPGVSCPACNERMECTWKAVCDVTETCMVRSYMYPGFNFTTHCIQRDDCHLLKLLAKPHGEIFCCENTTCLHNILGID
ncbi:uncharacterized protein LOC144624862 isoform X2 [Crassostrea virginica]